MILDAISPWSDPGLAKHEILGVEPPDEGPLVARGVDAGHRQADLRGGIGAEDCAVILRQVDQRLLALLLQFGDFIR